MKRKTRIILLIFISFCFFTLYSCYSHKADLCETANVRLSVELNAIMTANCFRCHSSSNAAVNGGNYNLEDFATIQSAALDGRLYSSIIQDNKLAPPMPQDGGRLSDCEISQFEAWIN